REIGPITALDWRPDQNAHWPPTKKFVLVAGKGGQSVDVPLFRVQAVKRAGQEIIRFAENEGYPAKCVESSPFRAVVSR
ncbi:MAG TPA: hypothetical protein VFN02_15545, partial [Ktedonobacteraceae bacterium]|nr:hypothetical protein [Ktedonobacteraceae bacterium]